MKSACAIRKSMCYSEHFNVTLIIAKLYKQRPVFQCNANIMRALDVDFFHDALQVIGLSRVIACGMLYLESREL